MQFGAILFLRLKKRCDLTLFACVGQLKVQFKSFLFDYACRLVLLKPWTC